MKYKRIITAFLTFSILMLVPGCKTVEHKENPDPPSIDIMETVPLDFEMETDYDNISVETELTTYDLELLTLIVFEGYKKSEVAEKLGCSRSAITQRMKKIKKNLENA